MELFHNNNLLDSSVELREGKMSKGSTIILECSELTSIDDSKNYILKNGSTEHKITISNIKQNISSSKISKQFVKAIIY